MPNELIQFTILFLQFFIQLMYWIMMIYIIMSWFIRRPNAFWNMLGGIVRPIIKPFRWARLGMLDFSPLVALLVLDFVGTYFIDLLKTLLIS